MDENENRIPDVELPEFTLEDIMREFGSGSDDGKVHDAMAPELMEDLPQWERVADVPVAESAPAREEPEILVWDPAPKQEEPAPAELGSDTIRIDAEQVKAQSARGSVSGDTQPFTPVGE